MRIRLLLGSFVVLLLVLVGLWSTAYFHVSKAQKDFVEQAAERGYAVSFENVKTKGFPFAVTKTIERVIVRAKDEVTPVYVQGGPVKMTVSMLSPSKMHLKIGETKSTFDRSLSWNFEAAEGDVSLDLTNRKAKDTFVFTGVSLKKGDIQILAYPSMTSVSGIEKGSLFFDVEAKNSSMMSGEKIESIVMKGFLDTPYKTWYQFNQALAHEVTRFQKDIAEAVSTGQTELPIIYEWINTLEEQQIAGHFTFDITKEKGNSLLCKANLGVVDAMPHGMLSFRGEGPLFSVVSSSARALSPDAVQNEQVDVAIKSNGIFLGKTNVAPYQRVSWKNYPIVTEAIVCDTFKLYSHGAFRKARAENEQSTEHSEVQYAIGEGYLLDSDYEAALVWFKRAGLQHHPKALLHMAYHYFNGYGCEKNESLAREFTEDAVCQGVVLADELKEFADAQFVDWAVGIVGDNSVLGK